LGYSNVAADNVRPSPEFRPGSGTVFAPFGRSKTRHKLWNETLLRCVDRVIARSARNQEQKEHIMNWDRVEGNWKTFKGQVQQKWGKLTDDDLDVIEGKRTELAGRLQERYGYAKDEAEKNIDTWLKSTNN
jgi:uncharacterized protein YjbJ (UPF0337 family)